MFQEGSLGTPLFLTGLELLETRRFLGGAQDGLLESHKTL